MINKIDAGIVVLVAGFFLVLFSIGGIVFLLGIFFLFFLPVYLVVKNFHLTKIEKIFYSGLIGWGLFPTVVYYLAILISSMRYSIGISFILLTGAGFVLNKYLSKN